MERFKPTLIYSNEVNIFEQRKKEVIWCPIGCVVKNRSIKKPSAHSAEGLAFRLFS